ncbi:hypothetical protein GCM10022398_20420 [Acetobacter lovaniensis]|nr:hypothetical protein AA0474_1210 [Acetobacter lovaniensis NRIC 0474]
MQGSSINPKLPEPRHLIVHKRDKGRDDQSHAGPAQGWNLVTDTFAPTRGHEHKGILPLHGAFYGLRLQAPEPGEPKDSLQHILHGPVTEPVTRKHSRYPFLRQA